ncbi:MAG: triose-phosphate isomerase [Planctomycetota bacterium]
MARPTIVAGNWKLNPPRDAGLRLFRDLVQAVGERTPCAAVEVLICPPAVYLGGLQPGAGITLGAQDVSPHDWGAHTGEVGAALLRSFGVTRAIIGHSERRQERGETDGVCGQKVVAALRAGVAPMLCVGETQAEHDAGETFEVVERQLRIGLESASGPAGLAAKQLAIAYEPVWAIGTGRTATPAQAGEVHRFLRNRLAEVARSWRTVGDPVHWAEEVAILYGGSVKPDNAAALFEVSDIDGALVGGASLEADSFMAIVDAARARS